MNTLRKHSLLFFQLLIIISFTGCGQSFYVTRQGDLNSGDNISYDQFNRLRTGKYFEMNLKDSSVIQITLVRAGIDSIVYETGDDPVRQSLPIGSVSMLLYHQNDNGFNTMIGGFGGLLLGGITAKSLFDFNNNESSIKGFATVIICSVVGAVIGYHNETILTYYFPPQRKKKI